MKKIVSLILAATMSTTVLSGCVMSGANEPDENSDANVSEISTVNESEKEYAETILAQVNERKSKNDNNYDGIIIKGIHGRDFFEVLDFRHNDLYLHYSNPILEKLTDYEYISNGRRMASFNQQPSSEELELIWKCADASLSESEFEEYRNQLIDLISKPTSSFFFNSETKAQDICASLIIYGLVYDKLSSLSAEQIDELSEKKYDELMDYIMDGNPDKARLEKLLNTENSVKYIFDKMFLDCYKDVKNEYENLNKDQEKNVYLLRLISNYQSMRYYDFVVSAFSNLEAQCAGLISLYDEKLTLQKAEEIIAANMDKSDPVEAVLQEFLSVQKYPDWHIAGDREKVKTMNRTVHGMDSYYEFISPGENGTAESITVISHSGIVYHKYDADDHLIDEKILLVDFDKNFEYNESERTIHHG